MLAVIRFGFDIPCRPRQRRYLLKRAPNNYQFGITIITAMLIKVCEAPGGEIEVLILPDDMPWSEK